MIMSSVIIGFSVKIVAKFINIKIETLQSIGIYFTDVIFCVPSSNNFFFVTQKIKSLPNHLH